MSKLYVDEIQPKTTGGVIGIPTQIAFDVSRISSGAEGVNQVIVFNHVTTNVGNAYNPSNGRFTAPVSGTYEFSHTAFGAGNTGGGGLASSVALKAFFRKNGSATTTTKYGFMYSYVQAISYPNISSKTILTLAQNDYIEVYYDAYYMYVDTAMTNNFTGKLIGV